SFAVPLYRNAMQRRRAAVTATPNEPSVIELRDGPPPGPIAPVHKRKPFAKNVNARESAGLKNIGAALACEEFQTKEEDHQRANIEGMLDEFLPEPKWRIRNNSPAPSGCCRLQQKVTLPKTIRATKVGDIRADDFMAGSPQNIENVALATSRLPKA